MLTLNSTTAASIFDILVKKGNFENKQVAWTEYRKAEFIQNCEEGISEYWYPTNCGSSIKVYFHQFREQKASVYAQTINDIKEANLVSETNEALEELFASLRHKADAERQALKSGWNDSLSMSQSHGVDQKQVQKMMIDVLLHHSKA